ncbi:LpqB family beta-propeller domain-containing protein [Bifidobacterium sp. ESL0763]|uniref:LpqB family beta-propeller domain-containing protein n=1 Tax=Bifidobacterium sp. ESL0763 TaxID=2983227 RepID=UPI0023F7E5FA|nr:LpqB family beta-propeller domain-containing protein [Bifidobacterium sp. ESL0763]MDF7663689.1 LpqB family beta-propeller domain-containing protein [Bifidobacterium sp. ESL0763]
MRHSHGMRGPVRLAFAVLTALALVALPSGCSNPMGFPESGAVQRLPAAEPRSKRVFTNPRGPKDGDQPEQIVKGFLDAMPAGVQSDGFHVARSFLTGTAARGWDGDSTFLIALSAPKLVRSVLPQDGGEDSSSTACDVQADVRLKGQLDAGGQYTAAESGTVRSLTFSLRRSKGRWRIDRAPDVVVVLDADVDQVFRQVTLYRADAASRVLIPDVRWLAWRDWRVLAVRELLAGAPKWLGEAARNANTHAARLAVNAIPIVNDKVQIRLGDAFEQLPDADKAMLVREIRLTLGDGDADYDMEVTASSRHDYSHADAGLSIATAPASPPVYSLSAGNIVSLDSSAPLRVGVVRDSATARGFVFGPNGGALLAADSTAECLRSNGSACGPMFAGARLRQIAGGARNEVWALGEDGHTLMVQDGGSVQTLAIPWLGSAGVAGIAVSPDGSRLALAVQSGPLTGVVMTGIVRNQAGAPQRLGGVAARVSARYGVTMLTFYNDTTLVYVVPGSSGVAAQAFRQIGPGPEQVQRLPGEEVRAITNGRINDAPRLAAINSHGVVHSDSGALDGSWSIVDMQSTVVSQR